MFRAESWARAFTASAGSIDNAVAALELLRPLCSAALYLPGYVSGRNDAEHLDALIDRAFTATGTAGADEEQRACFLLAKRFLLLMVKKGFLRESRRIILEIEKKIDKAQGRIKVILETPFAADETFRAQLEKLLLQRDDVKEVKIRETIVPDLLGGFDLRIGSRLIDASVKTRLQKLSAHLGGQ